MPKASLSQRFFRSLVAGLVTSGSLVGQYWSKQPVQAATQSYCRFPREAIAAKENLLQASLKGNSDAQKDYKALLKKHADILRQCRARTWPQEQAIWLRLHPCDVRPGSLDFLLDRIVNRGYNKIYLEVFFDSQVLLPPADNRTPWISVVRSPGAEKVDLLAQAIAKGHERGLKVYAWMFTMNFGYAYAQLPDKQGVLARNGKGENSLSFVHDQSQAFIDPYNRQAQIDYYQLLEAVLKRRPDGVLFDYIRYPRGTGSQSVASKVKDLWIYGNASRQALYERAKNSKGRSLIERYVSQGDITVNDVVAVDRLYPQEGAPLWQGRNPSPLEAQASANIRHRRLRLELWNLSLAHAAQGVLDFLSFVSLPVQRQKIPAGAVFFPGGNQVVGQRGFDSRLQAWDQFPASLEWHPMSYGVCGHTKCIVNQLKRVTSMATPQTKIVPAIAGIWGKDYNNRPSLEAQMQAIRAAAPQVKSVSHFAYSWQDPEFDHQRRFCKL